MSDLPEPEITPAGGGVVVKPVDLPSIEEAAFALHSEPKVAASDPEEPAAKPQAEAASSPEPKPTIDDVLAREREKLETRMRELEWREKQVSQGLELQQLAQQDPYEAWKRLNIPFRDLASRVANEGRPDPIQETSGKLEQLAQTVQKLQAELAEERAIAKTREVMAKSDEYKLLQALGREKHVAQYALQNNGDYERAVREVLELVDGDLKRLEEAGLISRSKPVEQKREVAKAAESVTLNNSLSSTPSREPRRASEGDDFQRLIENIKGSLV